MTSRDDLWTKKRARSKGDRKRKGDFVTTRKRVPIKELGMTDLRWTNDLPSLGQEYLSTIRTMTPPPSPPLNLSGVGRSFGLEGLTYQSTWVTLKRS